MGAISAVVTLHKDNVAGGAPIFVEANVDNLEKTAFLLEKILNANAHDLKNGTYILVKHN
jgi:hypothetical protein